MTLLRSLLSAIGIFLIAAAATAQPRPVLVVMTQGTGLTTQFWSAISTPPTYLQQQNEAGAYLTLLTGMQGSWLAVVSSGSPFVGPQQVRMSPQPAGLGMQGLWSQGYSITDIGWSGGNWTAVASGAVGYGEQTVLAAKEFPEADIQAKLSQGFAVTSITYGDTLWAAVLTRNTPFTSQLFVTSVGDFPDTEIQQRMQEGYRITDAGFGGGKWVIVLSKGGDYGRQVYQVDSSWTDEETVKFINNYWTRSFHITTIVNTTLWPSFGSGNNQLIQIRLTQQATPTELNWYDSFIRINAPLEDAFLAVQRIAGMYVGQKKWKEAADVYRKYQPLFPVMEERFRRSIQVLEAPEEISTIQDAGPGVNTERGGEYVPVPTADGNGLFFTGRERPDGVGGEDIYFSTLQNGVWGKAQLVKELSTGNSEATTAVSADANQLVVFSASAPRRFGGGDLYLTERTPSGWGPLQLLPKPINSEYWDSDGMITSDGKAILFTSERPGGVGQFQSKDRYFHGETWGNTDIYVCLKTATGWSDPINLGPTINTPYAERTPFLHPDGKTLYFSTSGREGFGTLDVFKTTRLREDSWTEWSQPVHLGKAFNTIGSDWGYKVTTDGQQAFFAAGNKIGTSTSEDIFWIPLPKSLRPDPVATIRGVVTDPKGKPLIADIKWEDLDTRKSIGQLKTDPQKGSYFITVPLGKNYGYYAEKSGYYPVTNNVDLRKTKEAVNLTVNITLVPIKEVAEEGMAVRINNVFFDTDKSDLKPESRVELDRLAELIKSYPKARVEIAGYTDNVSGDAYNQQLSQRRAQAVVDYLSSVGIERARLVPKGNGEKNPVASNDTEEGRSLNRRVEFRFLKK